MSRGIIFYKNVNRVDRMIRAAAGLVLSSWAVAGGPAWTYLGFYLLASAAWGVCIIYWTLGKNSEE